MHKDRYKIKQTPSFGSFFYVKIKNNYIVFSDETICVKYRQIIKFIQKTLYVILISK